MSKKKGKSWEKSGIIVVQISKVTIPLKRQLQGGYSMKAETSFRKYSSSYSKMDNPSLLKMMCQVYFQVCALHCRLQIYPRCREEEKMGGREERKEGVGGMEGAREERREQGKNGGMEEGKKRGSEEGKDWEGRSTEGQKERNELREEETEEWGDEGRKMEEKMVRRYADPATCAGV